MATTDSARERDEGHPLRPATAVERQVDPSRVPDDTGDDVADTEELLAKSRENAVRWKDALELLAQ